MITIPRVLCVILTNKRKLSFSIALFFTQMSSVSDDHEKFGKWNEQRSKFDQREFHRGKFITFDISIFRVYRTRCGVLMWFERYYSSYCLLTVTALINYHIVALNLMKSKRRIVQSYFRRLTRLYFSTVALQFLFVVRHCRRYHCQMIFKFESGTTNVGILCFIPTKLIGDL